METNREADYNSSERLILLKHLLFSTKVDTSWTLSDLQEATAEVAHKLNPPALKYLDSVYEVWKKHLRYQRGEIGKAGPSIKPSLS